MRAVELKTGKVLWKMLASQNGGSVTLLKDHLMMIRDDGEIFKIKPDADKKVRAFSAIGNEMVCLRNTHTLACLR